MWDFCRKGALPEKPMQLLRGPNALSSSVSSVCRKGAEANSAFSHQEEKASPVLSGNPLVPSCFNPSSLKRIHFAACSPTGHGENSWEKSHQWPLYSCPCYMNCGVNTRSVQTCVGLFLSKSIHTWCYPETSAWSWITYSSTTRCWDKLSGKKRTCHQGDLNTDGWEIFLQIFSWLKRHFHFKLDGNWENQAFSFLT